MFKEIIKGMEYADWYGIVSLLIFFYFFPFPVVQNHAAR